jgi:hypothetical protein
MPRTLDTHRTVTMHRPCTGRAPGGLGRPKAVIWAVRAGLRSSEPLWPWAVVRPEGIVKFLIFPWIYSNVIQIQFGLNWICSKFVQTYCLNGCHSSQWIQIREYELGFQLNLIKPFWKILIIV